MTKPVLHENNVTFRPESDYSLSVVLQAKLTYLLIFLRPSNPAYSLPKINGYSGVVLRFIRS